MKTFKEDVFCVGKTDQSHFLPEHDTISKNVDRLIFLVNDLLTISSLEQGAVPELEVVALDQLTSEVIERLVPMASERQVPISYRSENHLTLRADPSKLAQVLENLIGNAIKYGLVQGKS